MHLPEPGGAGQVVEEVAAVVAHDGGAGRRGVGVDERAWARRDARGGGVAAGVVGRLGVPGDVAWDGGVAGVEDFVGEEGGCEGGCCLEGEGEEGGGCEMHLVGWLLRLMIVWRRVVWGLGLWLVVICEGRREVVWMLAEVVGLGCLLFVVMGTLEGAGGVAASCWMALAREIEVMERGSTLEVTDVNLFRPCATYVLSMQVCTLSWPET